MDTSVLISKVSSANASPDKIKYIGGDRIYFSRKIPDDLALELNRLLDMDFSKSDQNSLVKGNLYLEERLLEIHEQWPGCVDPYMALFKFYFRVVRYQEAERMVWRLMTLLSDRNQFCKNYRLLKPCTTNWLLHDSDPRHFLFCLKALGVIRLRRGKVFLAKKVLSKLEELDPNDEIGGSNFLFIARSFDE
ncbi:hypothetical protein [Sessilibacter sp. MAH4]